LRRALEAPQARRGAARPPPPAPRPGGEAGRAPAARRYTADDFLFFRPYSFGGRVTEPKFTEDIAPVGLGLLGALPGLVFLFARRGSPGRTMARLWLLAALLLALGPYLGLNFYAWRAWMLIAPFACLAAADLLGAPPRPRAPGVVG